MFGRSLIVDLIRFFNSNHRRKRRQEDKLRRQQKARERRFQEQRAREQFEEWADDNPEKPACGICRGSLSEDTVNCPGCQTAFHSRCWQVGDGCNRCDYRISVMEE